MAYAAERTSNTQNGVCHVKQDRGMGSGGNSFKVVCRHASCTYFSKCKKNTRGEWVFVERSGHICGFNVNQGSPNIGNTPVMAAALGRHMSAASYRVCEECGATVKVKFVGNINSPNYGLPYYACTNRNYLQMEKHPSRSAPCMTKKPHYAAVDFYSRMTVRF